MEDFTFTYSSETRSATIVLARTGEKLVINNISAEQAAKWEQEKAAEFARCGFRMHTPTVEMKRGAA